jgi:hypothetical protein
MRLRADIWVAAYLRRCHSANIDAVLIRRGAAEAGAIFVKIDRLDGCCALFGPAPQTETATRGVDRLWQCMHKQPWLACTDIEAALARELKFDPDIWIIGVDDKEGRHFLDITD